ncbi:LamG-like jellyroll fold domain-containing protein [uncultured Flavobacterium sp.]|uniref:LamG-like jellyroll fold domain-containing protein n=1 Tax=uncultured Flavobacterium sp. TaxID=165435 RepID=UPI0030C7E8FA
MKQNYFLIGLFLLIFNHSYSTYLFQVSGVEPLTGGQSYLVNQPSNPLGLSILVCAFGNSQPSVATSYTLTWYKNTVNSTVGGIMVSQSNYSTVNQYNLIDIKTYLPDTSQQGTFYYYAVLSNPSHTSCGFTGTLTSTIQTVNVHNPATHLNFDGVNDYVSIPSGINVSNSSFTIEFNAKRTATDVFNYVLTQGVQVNNNLLHIGFRDNNNFTFAFWYNDINIPVTSYTADSEWHHWSCVYNITNGTRQVYQDGVLVGSDSGVVPYMGSGILDLGAFDGSSAFFNGNIDDVRIWNVARTLNEINTSKNCELQGTETGLIAYYKFNQGYDAGNNTTNITLTDATSNANNGTLTNFALTGTTSNWLAGSPVGVSSVITLQPQDQTVSETDPLIFTVNATGVSSYQWEYSADNGVTWSTLDDTFTDPNVSGSTTNTLTISGIGMIGITGYKFRVILDGTSMCTSTSNEVLATVTLETKSFGISNVKVYPNPSTGIFTIDIVEELEFTVYDIVGKTIINQKSLVGSNTLDLSRFEKGIYLLALMNSKGETNTYKLIKE